jgi:REP element-mobilizing transposase RayT
VYGYVIMPEHVHMPVREPEHETLAEAMPSAATSSTSGVRRSL